MTNNHAKFRGVTTLTKIKVQKHYEGVVLRFFVELAQKTGRPAAAVIMSIISLTQGQPYVFSPLCVRGYVDIELTLIAHSMIKYRQEAGHCRRAC